MSSKRICETTVEESALAWLESLGYTVESGPEIEWSGHPIYPKVHKP
jgi:hypothetical protein